MKPRTAIVLLAVVGLVLLAVIVQGGHTSAGNSQSRSSLVDALGKLRSGRQVVAADLTGASCAGNNPGTLRVIGQCEEALPSGAKRLQLCVVSGQPAFLGVKGASYPLQQADLAQSACPASGSTDQHDGAHFDLYDSGNSLIVVCSAMGVPCLLRLDD